jgi:hypothetical protein
VRRSVASFRVAEFSAASTRSVNAPNPSKALVMAVRCATGASGNAATWRARKSVRVSHSRLHHPHLRPAHHLLHRRAASADAIPGHRRIQPCEMLVHLPFVRAVRDISCEHDIMCAEAGANVKTSATSAAGSAAYFIVNSCSTAPAQRPSEASELILVQVSLGRRLAA